VLAPENQRIGRPFRECRNLAKKWRERNSCKKTDCVYIFWAIKIGCHVYGRARTHLKATSLAVKSGDAVPTTGVVGRIAGASK